MRHWALRAARWAWMSITFKLLLVLVARLLHQPQLALSPSVLIPYFLLDLLQEVMYRSQDNQLTILHACGDDQTSQVSPHLASECISSTAQ